MAKPTITRERLEQLADNNTICKVSWDERIELAQIVLAAMDSESGCLPLDYLQGHKDGLEWAAQLAEANHPETGDWLYDDPIELEKAIRKGPDMPPVQPVADSEPDRNPVLAYADSYRDMAKQGVESVPIWSDITDLERNIAPLYRHAQPAPASEPVYQYWCYTTVENSEGDPEEFWFWKDCEKDFYDRWENAKRTLYNTPQQAPIVPEEMYWQDEPVDGSTRAAAYASGWNACRAAMLAAAPQSPGTEPATVPGKWIPVSERMPENKPGSYEYLVFETLNNRVNHDYWNVPSEGDDAFTPFWNHYGEHVTHWMPLPAVPQEVSYA